MFIPLGGIFIFGGCDSRACVVNRIILGAINLVMGTIALVFAFSYDLLLFKIIGFIIAGMGLMMIVINLFGLRKAKAEPNELH